MWDGVRDEIIATEKRNQFLGDSGEQKTCSMAETTKDIRKMKLKTVCRSSGVWEVARAGVCVYVLVGVPSTYST